MICSRSQHDYEKSRARHDKEEKLIISAWYNMVSKCTLTQKSRILIIVMWKKLK